MSKVNMSNLQLVNRRNLVDILKNGFSKQSTQDASDKDKVYLNVKGYQENDEKPISPENISVVILKNKQTQKLSTSHRKIEETITQMQEGNSDVEYDIKGMPLNQYMNKMRSMQLQEFQKKIQSRDNYHLGDVALLITTANRNNDMELLAQMIELIKRDPNYEFAFDGGKLDLDKLYDMSRMDRSKVEDGMDKAEEIEARGGDIDSTEIEADKIAEYSEKTVEEIEQTIEQEIQEQEEQETDEIDEEKASSRVNQLISKMTKRLAQGIVMGLLARVARMNIRDKIRNRAEDSRQKNPKTQLKNDKEKEDEFHPYRTQTEVSQNEPTKPKTSQANFKEIESRQQRERIEKEIAVQTIEQKLKDGKELSKNEQHLYQEHLNEVSKNEKNALENTLERYALQNNEKIQRALARVGKEAAQAQEKGIMIDAKEKDATVVKDEGR